MAGSLPPSQPTVKTVWLETARTEAGENAILWFTGYSERVCLTYYLWNSCSFFLSDYNPALKKKHYSLQMYESLSVYKTYQSKVDSKEIGVTFAKISSSSGLVDLNRSAMCSEATSSRVFESPWQLRISSCRETPRSADSVNQITLCFSTTAQRGRWKQRGHFLVRSRSFF